jgi:hypothetical protein
LLIMDRFVLRLDLVHGRGRPAPIWISRVDNAGVPGLPSYGVTWQRPAALVMGEQDARREMEKVAALLTEPWAGWAVVMEPVSEVE